MPDYVETIVDRYYRHIYKVYSYLNTMYSLDRLRDIRELELFLFEGLSEAEYNSRQRVATSEKRGHITGRLTYDPETRQISYHKKEAYQSDPTPE